MVIGARQVGKTYLLEQFCKENFKNYYYINFMKEKRFIEVFESMDSFDKKVQALDLLVGGSIRNGDNTILFVDEAQESEDFIESLKFFNESSDSFNIVCAGSLLGVAFKRFNSSFPVGKVILKNMYPLDFEEFLWATNNDKYIDIIRDSFSNNTPLNSVLHDTLLDLFNKYLYLGGMPNVINNFLDNNMNMSLIDNDVIKQIIEAYFNDMSRYADDRKTIRIKNLYSCIPSQLAKENQKFIFTTIDPKDNRKRDYITVN